MIIDDGLLLVAVHQSIRETMAENGMFAYLLVVLCAVCCMLGCVGVSVRARDFSRTYVRMYVYVRCVCVRVCVRERDFLRCGILHSECVNDDNENDNDECM